MEELVALLSHHFDGNWSKELLESYWDRDIQREHG